MRREIKQDGWRLHVLSKTSREKNVPPDISRSLVWEFDYEDRTSQPIYRVKTKQDRSRADWAAGAGRPDGFSQRTIRMCANCILSFLSLHFARLSWDHVYQKLSWPRIHSLQRFATIRGASLRWPRSYKKAGSDVTRIYRGLTGKKIHHDTFDLDQLKQKR